MAEYAIGDIQGCYNALQLLLNKIQFNERSDRLWLVGDLINRGPQSLEVLKFLYTLPIAPRISLGNHDLHFLKQLWDPAAKAHAHDTLSPLLNAPEREELGQWLRMQPILCYDANLNVVMCHAGIAPFWSLDVAIARAHEVELVLQGPKYRMFLTHLYDKNAIHWSSALQGMHRLRVICNYFTNMRYCELNGDLALKHKGPPHTHVHQHYPWYALPNRVNINADIVFGHWSALQGQCPNPHIHALDTGCVWGGQLTAMRLHDKQRFTIGTFTK